MLKLKMTEGISFPLESRCWDVRKHHIECRNVYSKSCWLCTSIVHKKMLWCCWKRLLSIWKLVYWNENWKPWFNVRIMSYLATISHFFSPEKTVLFTLIATLLYIMGKAVLYKSFDFFLFTLSNDSQIEG